MFKAGDQFPGILFSDRVGNSGIISPEQIGGICVKIGVIPDFIVRVTEVVVAQEPAVGVNL